MDFAQIGFAFLEGLGLILSPCILPVLPLVLAASIEGGRARPFGVITGFIVSFTAFALLSRQLVSALNIDLDIIKNVSLVLLAIFGLILLSKTLSEKFSRATQDLASFGGGASMNTQGGFLGGILIGLLIGLVWTPCAGPLLAAVLVQVIRQQSDTQALFVISSFAVGAGLPMLAIALSGQRLTRQLGFFARQGDALRRVFGMLILLAVAFIYSSIDVQSLFTKKEATATFQYSEKLQHALPNPYSAPEFTGIDAWLNSQPLTMQGLRGKVVLVDFWTYSCINCVRTFPYITAWDKKYRDAGLVIVGVHSPEFEFERKRENVEAAIKKNGIKYPVALDNRLDTFVAFENRYWPAHYLIDREGRIVYTHFGEGEYAQTENNIRALLGLNKTADTMPEKAEYDSRQTPETYLGYARAERFLSPGGINADNVETYTLPESLPEHGWALGGAWKVENEGSIAQEAGASLRFNFTARKVFLVMGTATGIPVSVALTLNGQPVGSAAGKDSAAGIITVNTHTLYELIDQREVKGSMLEIKANAPGLEVYAFTFGS